MYILGEQATTTATTKLEANWIPPLPPSTELNVIRNNQKTILDGVYVYSEKTKSANDQGNRIWTSTFSSSLLPHILYTKMPYTARNAAKKSDIFW